MMTSGAPFFAEIAVWNFAYSGWPCPALVQHTCTSVCPLLKLSTTLAMFGYQAQTRTRLASSCTILLVQLVGFDAVLSSPQPATPRATTVRPAATIERLLLERISGLLVSSGRGRSRATGNHRP